MPHGDPAPAITVTAGADRPSRAEQVAQLCARAAAKADAVRVRIPFMIYDYGDGTKGGDHIHLRDAALNLQLPPTTTPEDIEQLIHAVTSCVRVGAVEGWEGLLSRLEGPARA